MILLWGPASDGPLRAVADALGRQRAPFMVLDQAQVLDCALSVRIESSVHGRLRTPDRTIDLDEVGAGYLRADRIQSILAARSGGAGHRELEQATKFEDLFLAWSELTPALMVNRPGSMASNGSKPYQARLIAAHGFAVPDTLVTTDEHAVIAFAERHRAVVYKSLSGIRSIVARLTPEHRGRLADLAWCPTQFQEFIPGTDYRVHVIGSDVFASQIISTADDYRYASSQGLDIRIRPCEVPAEIERRCISLAASLDLAVAGIDLRLTPDGHWYCFEVNPSPGFSFYEGHTGQPIAETIALLLQRGAAGA